VCRLLAETMPDRRDPDRIRHAMFEMVMSRVLAIACGHEDAIDLDRLRHDPLMKLAVGRCPESGRPLASQSKPAGECAKQDRCGAASNVRCSLTLEEPLQPACARRSTFATSSPRSTYWPADWQRGPRAPRPAMNSRRRIRRAVGSLSSLGNAQKLGLHNLTSG
jgi:hypothetical protein